MVLALLVGFIALCRQALQVYQRGVEQLDVLFDDVRQLTDLRAEADATSSVQYQWVLQFVSTYISLASAGNRSGKQG
jgi:hypothetical protein